MSKLKNKIDEILNNKGLSHYRTCRLIGCNDSTLSRMMNGKLPFSKNIRNKILPILEITEEEFESLVIADKYPKEIIKKAVLAKQNPPAPVEIPQQKTKDTKSPILTTQIDKLILKKGLSRTKLSKLINYGQGIFNQMIIGKYKISGTVIERLSEVLEISQEDIKAWVLADKYSLEVLCMAWDVCISEGDNKQF